MEKKDYSFYVTGMTDERFTEIALTSVPAKDFPEYWESPYFYDGNEPRFSNILFRTARFI